MPSRDFCRCLRPRQTRFLPLTATKMAMTPPGDQEHCRDESRHNSGDNNGENDDEDACWRRDGRHPKLQSRCAIAISPPSSMLLKPRPSRYHVTSIDEPAYCSCASIAACTLAQRAGTTQAKAGHGAQSASGMSRPCPLLLTLLARSLLF